MDKIKIDAKSLDEFKRDAFRRRIIAACLAEEYSTKTSEIKKKIETIEMNTDLIISSLKKSREYYKEYITKLGQFKIESTNKERANEIEKYLKIFEENHKKIDKEYEKQVKQLDELLKNKLKEIEEKYEYYSYVLDPMNNPSYYLLETIREKGIDTSFITGNKDIDMELGNKLYEYNKKIKEYESQRDKEKETVINDFIKAKSDLEIRFKEFRKKVEEKEKQIIEKINENYDKKIKEIESETINSINSKIQSIDITIALIENKKESTISKFDSEIITLKNEFKAKIESLMQPLSPIPDELLSKYIYCKIEIKKPEIIEQKAEEVKEEKKDTVENKDEAKDLEDTKNAASQLQPVITSETKALYWNANKEKSKKFMEKLNAFCRYVRTAFYATALSSLFLLVLKDTLNTPTSLISNKSIKDITSISDTAKSIGKEIKKNEDRKGTKDEITEGSREKKSNVLNQEISVSNKDVNEKDKIDEEKHFEKMFISIDKELDEYNAARLNFETQLELFELYVKEIKPSFGEVIGVSKGRKVIANELLQKLKRLGYGLSKEKMNLIADALKNARLYNISELRKYIDQIISMDEDQLFGVDPTGKIVPILPPPKIIHNPKQDSNPIIRKEKDTIKVNPSSDTISLNIIDSENIPNGSGENTVNEENVNTINPISEDPKSYIEEKNMDDQVVNQVVKYEELIDAIIICENKAMFIKVPKGYNIKDNDPYICNTEY
ncbi:MAG: hypothetical protein QXO35_01720 [Candidatus Micrarchaeia archaeon]